MKPVPNIICVACGDMLLPSGICTNCNDTVEQAGPETKGVKSFAFEIKTLVMVEAESEDEAWDLLPATAREAICDFDYERSPEDDES